MAAFGSDQRHQASLRYVERNAVRAGLVASARSWRWCSAAAEAVGGPDPHAGPVPRPADWLERVDTPQTEAEVEALRECVRRRRPFGAGHWTTAIAQRLGITASLRPLGRPRKRPLTEPTLFGDDTDDP